MTVPKQPRENAAVAAVAERKNRSDTDDPHSPQPADAEETVTTKVVRSGATDLVSTHGGKLLSEISDAPPAPLLLNWLGKGRGRLDPEGHTMLFGPGGVGKGSLASYWAVELTRAGHRVLVLDHEMHPTEWARRVSSLGGSEARERIIHFPLRGPLTDYAEDMRNIAQDGGYTYAIVDSAAVAAQGKAEDSDAADNYSAAVSTLGIPVLTLAHLTKAHDARYPFGSVFWHNLARLTWSITPANDGKVLLRNRKANNYPNQGRCLVTFSWRPIARPSTQDDEEQRYQLQEVSERPYQSVLADDLQELLAEEGRMKLEDIVSRLNGELDEGAEKHKKETIQKALGRHPMISSIEKKWELIR